MRNILLAFEVVFPIFCFVAIGYVLRLLRFYDGHALDVINKLVFKVFLPCMLFYNIYCTELSEVFDGRLLLFAIGAVLAVFCCMMLAVPRFSKENARRGVIIQGVFRSNFVLFGLPVTISLQGEGQAGLTSLLIAVIVPLYNILAVICLESFRRSKVQPGSILLGIAKNPLILASVCGILLLLSGIRLPDMFETTLRDLSRVATPLALIGLGGALSFGSVRKNTEALACVLLLKLALVPAAVLWAGVSLFGFRGTQLVTLISMLSAPTAVSSFTMAQQMGGDADLAAQIVVFTTVCSIFSVFAIVAVTKSMGLF